MAMGRGRRRSMEYGEFWPGYVDVLSTLLLVVTFLMSIFMLSQYFATQEAAGKDTVLQRLNRQISELTSLLSLEKGKSKEAQDEMAELQAMLATLKSENEKLSGVAALGDESAKSAVGQIGTLTSELDQQKAVSQEALAKVDLLNQQLAQLRRQIAALNEALDASEKKGEVSDKTIKDLGQRLNDLLKDRKDIRVVGDRFVFESEVLFASGAAALTPEGLAALDPIATAIADLGRQIPKEVDWVVQIDGHTDIRPIASAQFPSNWELSTARASSVVKHMIARGVPAERLVAAGYGEYQPIESGTDDASLQKNRRIELKLTNR